MAIEVPDHLRGRPFTTREANASAFSAAVLTGRRFRPVFRGVWICSECALSPVTRIRAAALILPTDLRHPRDIVRRVHDALVRRGYTGGDPQFSVMWARWFN